MILHWVLHRVSAGFWMLAVVASSIVCTASTLQGQIYSPPLEDMGKLWASLEIARAEAEAGDADTKFVLGLCLREGIRGVPQDKAEAVKWFRKAADLGHANAQCALGTMYYAGEGTKANSGEAALWWRKAAEQNFVVAQFYLGCSYKEGEGVPKDLAEALSWYRRAAEQGYAEAQFALGVMYTKNDGIPQNEAEAIKWYRKAADQGHTSAQYNLAGMYWRGEGIPQNYVLAHSWASIAAASGDAKSRERRDILAKVMTPAQIAEAQNISAAFKPRPAPPFAFAQRGAQPPDAAAESPSASGSGFFVTENGYVVTNHHVIADARRVTITTAKGTFPAKIVRQDVANDLALLKVECTVAALHVRGSRAVKLADRVATVGYPNPGMQGLSPKYSSGEISSINGPGDDPRLFQISVPLQPGNSGGPLVDECGLVVGVIVAKLDQMTALKQTGQLPENVNYAIKGSLLAAFLESVPDVADKLVAIPSRKAGDKVDPSQAIQPSAVMVLVYK